MSKPWKPRLVGTGPTNRRRPRPERGVSIGEIRLVLFGGVFLGLAYASVPAGAGAGVAVADPESVSVIDGDTFRYGGEKIRIADIDTPETHPPRCAYEAELGERATRRLEQLLTQGPFELEPADRDEDRYGRKLRIVTRGGQSLGDVLVAEGLARPYAGGRRPWCG
ncbi:MAG TPA: thermonuclease family protein [Allosphingosinicella sp.]|nr:thermonuclease family protein [Allosphingosinicella sp.]